MGEKFGEERAAQRKLGQAVPERCLLVFIAMVGGGPLRDGAGEGRQYVREGGYRDVP